MTFGRIEIYSSLNSLKKLSPNILLNICFAICLNPICFYIYNYFVQLFLRVFSDYAQPINASVDHILPTQNTTVATAISSQPAL